jgi:hypothetical protein|tara:strand:+ start:722 stop:883 length:162 start_codon:yes stop_codon:yes gene_type:complete
MTPPKIEELDPEMPPLEEEETADTAAAPGVRDASSLGRDRERQMKSIDRRRPS